MRLSTGRAGGCGGPAGKRSECYGALQTEHQLFSDCTRLSVTADACSTGADRRAKEATGRGSWLSPTSFPADSVAIPSPEIPRSAPRVEQRFRGPATGRPGTRDCSGGWAGSEAPCCLSCCYWPLGYSCLLLER